MTSETAFPDLLSAALLGAGISGDDLAFDFDDDDDDTDIILPNLQQHSIVTPPTPVLPQIVKPQQPVTVVSSNGQQPFTTLPPQQTTVSSSSSPSPIPINTTNNKRLTAQVIPSPLIRTIRPPIRAQQHSQAVRIRGVAPTSTAVNRSVIPQGVQSFRIVRAPGPRQPIPVSGTRSVLTTQSQQLPSPHQVLRSQPIPRHLNHQIKPQTTSSSSQVVNDTMPVRIVEDNLPSTHVVNIGNSVDVSTKKILRIPPAAPPTSVASPQQLIIESQGGNSGQSKLIKVTSTNGKPVSAEEITKIVNSIPNLKSGSKIIVSANGGIGGHKESKTIQVVGKNQSVINGRKNTSSPLPSPSVINLQKHPNISQLRTTKSIMIPSSTPQQTHLVVSTQGIPSGSNFSTSISCLPFPTSSLSSTGSLHHPQLSPHPHHHHQHPALQQHTHLPPHLSHQAHHLGQLGSLSSVLSSSSSMLSPVVMDKPPKPSPFRQSISQKDLAKAWGDAASLKRSHSAQTFMQNLVQKELPDEEEIEEEVEQLGHAETYADYKPSKLSYGKKHPDAVVETSSLSSVESPDVRYHCRLLDENVDLDCKLSGLQLESITYASQRHMTILPSGDRAGFLIGDGAGVGKGRTIAGIIFENYLHKRKRAVWLSVSNDLKVDAERDLRDIGATHIDVYPLNKFKYYAKLSSKENNSCKKGVVFATYSSLIGESQAEGKYNTRLKQLLKWLGHDFDGVIVFDECHKAKNLCPTGSSKPTKTGQTVLELQNRLPKARVVYASATGASEPKNMAYMTRLGLWGEGTPFKDFNEFIQAVERRGVGAMELVAMDAKLRGMYIARQLSFHGVSFRIEEIPLEKEFIRVYNLAVEMWVEAREMFQQAACLIDAEHRMKKSMWGQFWSAHQRFFKYLCISSKVNHCVDLAQDAVRTGKCVVIGLQSTGEARTMEQVEEAGGELTDFVSTAKGVFQSLVERHFPASTRGRALDIIKRVSKNHNKSPDYWGNKKKNLFEQDKKKSGHESSDPESNESGSSDLDDIGFISSSSGSDDSEGDGDNPFAGGWNSDDDDPWCKKKRKRKQQSPKKQKKKAKKTKLDKSKKGGSVSDDEDDEFDRALAKAGLLNRPATLNGGGASGSDDSNWEKASAMKSELLSRIEFLGEKLPTNTLDQLIDDLGGTESVAEMTGRKSRVVSTVDGVQFESRSETDVPLEILNLTEKQRFMDGEKDVAIISEAASSGISLQADRRVVNQKRRVHITLELPWSADRAIQQFGRTHRSNQVSAPEYVFLISALAGERRFAATVAKRLESLGALTHGDRRATESRDLSRFNIDNRYGRAALETVMKSVLSIHTDSITVPPPQDYKGDFFKDVKESLVGVGMINIDEKSGYATLEKDFNNISKFLNRILGMKVAVQNALFKYFTETLTAIILEAKRSGRWDMGILDLGSGEEKVRKIETKVFVGNTVTNQAKTELTKFAVERGMTWQASMDLWRRCKSMDEGFYCSTQDRNLKKTIVLAVIQGKNKKREVLFNLYRPNSGLQSRCETLEEIRKKYKKCLPDAAEPLWEEQFLSSETQCSHKYWKGNCKRASAGLLCEFGLRTRFYWVLSGSVLSVWSKVESVLVGLSSASRMQIIRLRTEDNQRVVGSLIPTNGVAPLERALSVDSARTFTEKHTNSFNYKPYFPTTNNHSSSSSNNNNQSAFSSNSNKALQSYSSIGNMPNNINNTSLVTDNGDHRNKNLYNAMTSSNTNYNNNNNNSINVNQSNNLQAADNSSSKCITDLSTQQLFSDGNAVNDNNKSADQSSNNNGSEANAEQQPVENEPELLSMPMFDW